ncbi:MAG: helix-turn-helix domain-containing protein [Planctomycetes bacterium]|nr:helix-turn-helix domain-containing protein [Planctomycetota bacterium]
MHGEKTTPEFVPTIEAAEALGVPAAWLRREVEAGRVPSLHAGRRVLVSITDARAVLAERARKGEAVAR